MRRRKPSSRSIPLPLAASRSSLEASAHYACPYPRVHPKLRERKTEKKFLVGEEPTVPDFHLCELLDQNVMFDKECLQAFPRLQVLHSNPRGAGGGTNPTTLGVFGALPGDTGHRRAPQVRALPQHPSQQQDRRLGRLRVSHRTAIGHFLPVPVFRPERQV